MRIGAMSVQRANIRGIVHSFCVFKYVDEIRDRPVAWINLSAGVEKESFAMGEGISGEGADVAHVI